MIHTWLVYLTDTDGVALDRVEVPVADGAVEITLDPRELFANGTHGASQMVIRTHEGEVWRWPVDAGAWRRLHQCSSQVTPLECPPR